MDDKLDEERQVQECFEGIEIPSSRGDTFKRNGEAG